MLNIKTDNFNTPEIQEALFGFTGLLLHSWLEGAAGREAIRKLHGIEPGEFVYPIPTEETVDEMIDHYLEDDVDFAHADSYLIDEFDEFGTDDQILIRRSPKHGTVVIIYNVDLGYLSIYLPYDGGDMLPY